MRSCAVSKALLHKLRLLISVPDRCGWIGRAVGIREVKDVIMAKVIEFYIPTRFQRPLKAAPQVQYGKLVEFCLPTKKSA
jgi:hypothetical protein